MKTKALIIGFFCIFLSKQLTSESGSVNPLYWISFVGNTKSTATQPVFVIYLLEIDSLGNIVKPAKQVIRRADFGGRRFEPQTVAFSEPTSGKLVLWVNVAEDVPEEPPTTVMRAVVDKNTLTLRSFKKTSLSASFFDSKHLGVTQKNSNNFLVATVTSGQTENTVQAFGLTDRGRLNGITWLLEKPSESIFTQNVSSDGRYVLFLEKNVLYARTLGIHGRPHGLAKKIASNGNKFGGIKFADITGPLADGNRFIIYDSVVGALAPFDVTDHLFIQPVDNRSGEKIGSRLLIPTPVAQFYGGVAIDPDGRFFVYGYGSPQYQALDVTGRPSGSPKPLADTPAIQMDILKDSH